MKKLNGYKLLILVGVFGGNLSIASIIISIFPAFDKFTVLSFFASIAVSWWANREAELSRKSEDYKSLEAKMDSQDKIHSVALTELRGLFEFLNLRIDQAIEIQNLKTSVQSNTREIKKIEGFLGETGFKAEKTD